MRVLRLSYQLYYLLAVCFILILKMVLAMRDEDYLFRIYHFILAKYRKEEHPLVLLAIVIYLVQCLDSETYSVKRDMQKIINHILISRTMQGFFLCVGFRENVFNDEVLELLVYEDYESLANVAVYADFGVSTAIQAAFCINISIINTRKKFGYFLAPLVLLAIVIYLVQCLDSETYSVKDEDYLFRIYHFILAKYRKEEHKAEHEEMEQRKATSMHCSVGTL